MKRPYLPDPEYCRCRVRGRVILSVRRPGYRRRRMHCPACGHRWTTYLSVVSPARIHFVGYRKV